MRRESGENNKKKIRKRKKERRESVKPFMSMNRLTLLLLRKRGNELHFVVSFRKAKSHVAQ